MPSAQYGGRPLLQMQTPCAATAAWPPPPKGGGSPGFNQVYLLLLLRGSRGSLWKRMHRVHIASKRKANNNKHQSKTGHQKRPDPDKTWLVRWLTRRPSALQRLEHQNPNPAIQSCRSTWHRTSSLFTQSLPPQHPRKRKAASNAIWVVCWESLPKSPKAKTKLEAIILRP